MSKIISKLPFLTDEDLSSQENLEKAANNYFSHKMYGAALRVYREAEKRYSKSRNVEGVSRCMERIRTIEILTDDE